jgi:hypothetical protein
MDREVLWRRLKKLGVSGIRPDLGKQEMLEIYAEHEAVRTQRQAVDKERAELQAKFNRFEALLGGR